MSEERDRGGMRTIASTTSNSAEGAGAIEALEDNAGVVSKTTDDGGVENEPVVVAVALSKTPELLEEGEEEKGRRGRERTSNSLTMRESAGRAVLRSARVLMVRVFWMAPITSLGSDEEEKEITESGKEGTDLGETKVGELFGDLLLGELVELVDNDADGSEELASNAERLKDSLRSH